ncbi:MAG: CoA transferase, partial [Dehalococcoidia bacterium]|nr:CoA transferase [Dehalococcoidia bacterium]
MTSYRVLDLADETGAFCSRLLAGLGMDVVRIEPPQVERPRGPVPHKSLRFSYLNHGKRIVTRDLETPEGQCRILNMASEAD